MVHLSNIKVLEIHYINERRDRDRGYHPLSAYLVDFKCHDYMNADDPDLSGAEFVFKGDEYELYDQLKAWFEKSGWHMNSGFYKHDNDEINFSACSPDLWSKRRVRIWLRDLMNDLEHEKIEGLELD